MGIDAETHRARIGLYHAASVGRYLKRRQKEARRRRDSTCGSRSNPGEKLNIKPCSFVSCFIALLLVDYVLSLCDMFPETVLGFLFSGMKLCRGVVSAAVRRPQRSTVVALALLLIMAGDVERNPGPVEDTTLTLKNLVNVLTPVESKWYKLGVQLTVKSSKLKSFEADHHSCGRLLSETLEFWLNGNTVTPVTWESVVNALNSSSVDEKRLAAQILATFCQSTYVDSQDQPPHESKEGDTPSTKPEATCEATPPSHPCGEKTGHTSKSESIDRSLEVKGHTPQEAALPTAQAKTPSDKATPPDTTPDRVNGANPAPDCSNESPPIQPGQAEAVTPKPLPESSFPLLAEVANLSERERGLLETRLEVKSRDIMLRYFDFRDVFHKSLCDRCSHDFSLKELVRYLSRLKAYNPVEEVPPEERKSVFAEHMEQLKKATSVDDVLEVVYNYCSFFNYDIIKCMIEKYGTETDKLALQKYIEDFNEYAKRRIYECPSSFAKGQEEDANLHLKLDSRYDDYSVKSIKEFQLSFSEVLKVSDKALLLCRLDKGCIELSFKIPSFLQLTVFPLSTNQEAALSDLGVLSLTSGDYHFSSEDHQQQPPQEEGVCEEKTAVLESERGPGSGDQLFGVGFRVPHWDIDADSAFGGTVETSVFSQGETACSEFTADYLSDRDLEDKQASGLSTSDQGGSKGHELHIAAKNGDLERVKTLVETKHCNPLDGDKIGDNALHYAARRGSLKVLKYFVEEKNCNPACLGDKGRTPLHYASWYTHTDIVEYLISVQQVDPLCQDERQWTPLHHACKGGDLQVVRYLVGEMSKYMSINDILNERTKNHGYAPLHLASQFGHLNIMKFFISELKCNPNLQSTKYGATPLHLAAGRGHLHVVQYLVQKQKCDPMSNDRLQNTPLHDAAANGHLGVVQYLVNEAKYDPVGTGRHQNTPLHYAARRGHLEVVKFFIETLHCPPHIKGYLNCTPLDYARTKGHHHVVQYLQSLI